MNLSPKKHFLEKKEFADIHRDLVVATNFREALHAALLEQVISLPLVNDPAEAAAAYYRIVGARDFIVHLLNIAEQPKSAPTTPPANLDHRVK